MFSKTVRDQNWENMLYLSIYLYALNCSVVVSVVNKAVKIKAAEGNIS